MLGNWLWGDSEWGSCLEGSVLFEGHFAIVER